MKTKTLLLKCAWNYQDIMDYFGCKKDKAYQYMKIARTHYNGGLRFEPSKVNPDSVLAIFGTNRERELRLLTVGND